MKIPASSLSTFLCSFDKSIFCSRSHITVVWRANFQLAYIMARVANFILEGTAFESNEKRRATAKQGRSLSHSSHSECITVVAWKDTFCYG